MKGAGVDSILRKSQGPLQIDWITRINCQLDYFRNLHAEIDEFIYTVGNVNEEVCQWVVHTYQIAFVSIRESQKLKFKWIIEKSDRSKERNYIITQVDKQTSVILKNTWVVNVNVPDYDFSLDEKSLMKRGINYSATPTTLPVNVYVIRIGSACQVIGAHSKQAKTLRADCTKILKQAPPPPPPPPPKTENQHF